MIYTAITIRDGRITARHESTVPISAEMITNASYAGQELREVDPSTEYKGGYLLAEYTKEGKLRPLVERIKDGLTPCPAGWELVGDELVEITASPEEAPESIAQRLAELDTLKMRAETLLKEKKMLESKVKALGDTADMYSDLTEEIILALYKE